MTSGIDTDAGAETQAARRFARVLAWGARLGLAVLVAGFAAYVLGWAEPLVPAQRLPELWRLPVQRYLDASGMPAGWGWLALVTRADVAALAGIAVLAGCSALALLALAPLYARRRDWPYLLLCLAQVAVIALAASGWLEAGSR